MIISIWILSWLIHDCTFNFCPEPSSSYNACHPLNLEVIQAPVSPQQALGGLPSNHIPNRTFISPVHCYHRAQPTVFISLRLGIPPAALPSPRILLGESGLSPAKSESNFNTIPKRGTYTLHFAKQRLRQLHRLLTVPSFFSCPFHTSVLHVHGRQDAEMAPPKF